MRKILGKMTVSSVLLSVLVIVVAFLLWLGIRKVHKKYIHHEDSVGEIGTLVRVTFGVAKSLVILGAFLLVLEINGVNVSSVFAGLGLLSAVVGLALQDALKDIIMGIHIMSDHFYVVGDVVKYNDFEGVVVRFTMKTTTIESIVDQTILTVCNRDISQIVKVPAIALVDIDLPLSYEEDTMYVREILRDVCDGIAQLDGIDHCEFKGTNAFASSATIYKIRFFCDSSEKYERRRQVLGYIQNCLADANLKIPFEQIDVHTK